MSKTITVYGDCMLDSYVRCTPIRVSPEAPVLICKKETLTYAPGGAANVAADINSFGLDARLIGVQGTDEARDNLVAALGRHDISCKYLVGVVDWKTIEKCRFVDARGQQLLRLDTELENAKLSFSTQDTLQTYLCRTAGETDTLVISDYNKGTVTPELAQFAIHKFRSRGSYTIVNGKPDKLLSYRGANVLVYNLAEAIAAVQFGSGTDVISLARMLYERLDRTTDILITLGAEGMVHYNADGPITIDAVPTNVVDVTGAGDSVIAYVAAAGYCDREVLEGAAQYAAETISSSRIERNRI